jgi:cyclic pyranopterin phosphate synthase
MPADQFAEDHPFLKQNEKLSWEQLIFLVETFQELGVKKIRLTGGEPLLRKGLDEFIKNIKKTGIEEIALTTNGYYLEENAELLKNAGLDRLTVSLDTLDPDQALRINGKRDILPKILSGLEIASKVGFKQIKINTVIQKGVNDNEILDLVTFFKNKPFIVRFIEFMDVGTRNQWELSKVVPSKAIKVLINEKYPIAPKNPNYFGEVADRYQFIDGSGEVGFISSVTQPFCQNCTRARITSDGKFFTCLFAGQGLELKNLLDNNISKENLKNLISKAWSIRDDRYSEIRSQKTAPIKKMEMNHIGG